MGESTSHRKDTRRALKSRPSTEILRSLLPCACYLTARSRYRWRFECHTQLIVRQVVVEEEVGQKLKRDHSFLYRVGSKRRAHLGMIVGWIWSEIWIESRLNGFEGDDNLPDVNFSVKPTVCRQWSIFGSAFPVSNAFTCLITCHNKLRRLCRL